MERLHKLVNGHKVFLSEEEEEQIRNKWALEDDNRKAIEYIAMRKNEYPSIEEQLDMIYQDQIDGTTKWKDSITAIKQKYPKPNK